MDINLSSVAVTHDVNVVFHYVTPMTMLLFHKINYTDKVKNFALLDLSEQMISWNVKLCENNHTIF